MYVDVWIFICVYVHLNINIERKYAKRTLRIGSGGTEYRLHLAIITEAYKPGVQYILIG